MVLNTILAQHSALAHEAFQLIDFMIHSFPLKWLSFTVLLQGVSCQRSVHTAQFKCTYGVHVLH